MSLLTEVFHWDTVALAQALTRTFDALQEPRIVFKTVFEPIILRGKTNQQAGWLAG